MTTSAGCGNAAEGIKQENSALRFKMTSLAGEEVDLAQYEGKVALIVNVASKCGFTSQYEQLQELHVKYTEKGLAVLGFPCNQFLGQEPGTAQQIQEFCRVNYGVTFDLFEKVEVNGENACDLYRLLTSLDTEPKGAGKIGWNFEKFILDRNGFVVGRFGSSTKPNSPEIVALIEKELGKEALPSGSDESLGKAAERELNLAEFRWKNRLLLVFAASEEDEYYQNFRETWKARFEEVSDRDLLLIENFEQGTGRVGEARLAVSSAKKLRNRFGIRPGSTTFLLLGKDGTEKLRREAVVLNELFEVIDAMPMRQREMRERR